MKAIGLMAGTSLDGIDAAAVELRRGKENVTVKLLALASRPYTGDTVRMILEASDAATGTVDKIARLNFYLGELFAETAIAAAEAAGLKPSEIDCIGSHGQTIHHLPEATRIGRYAVRATMQIAEPAVIAARTGITTVADFRPADIAAGGTGAPLVPYVDYLLFRHRRRTRLLVNIGGISNSTYLPAGLDDPCAVQASDMGPGNMVIDELVRRLTNFRESCDRDGRYAARGKVIGKLKKELLDGPFFHERPPKSTGRELFGAAYVDRIVKQHPANAKADWYDLIATATSLTAGAIRRHYEKFYATDQRLDEVIVSGGGARNLTLMTMLAEEFAPAQVAASDEFGTPAEAKEAVAFAVLAAETMKGKPGNLPGATGAKERAVLGKIVPAP